MRPNRLKYAAHKKNHLVGWFFVLVRAVGGTQQGEMLSLFLFCQIQHQLSAAVQMKLAKDMGHIVFYGAFAQK
jgi:hypothetical protein